MLIQRFSKKIASRLFSRVTAAGVIAAAVVFSSGLYSAEGDIIYGSSNSGSAGNAIYSIDIDTNTASLLVGGLAVTPNSLGTDSLRNRLYYGDSNGQTIWSYDFQSNTANQVFDLNNSTLFSGLVSPTFGDGGSFYNGSYYAIIQRNIGSESGGGNSVYRFDLTTDGNSVSNIAELVINTDSGISIGDLGDFTIDSNGIAFGNSWDPPGNDTQISGYWSFDVNDTANSFQLLEDTSSLGNNAPTYQLATAADGVTKVGVDFFTPLRLDTLTTQVQVTAGQQITGFDGTSFNDLANSIIVVAVPEPSTTLFSLLLVVGVAARRRKSTRSVR
jgi:hypothetical protein